MTTDPETPLLSPHPDVSSGALRATLDQKRAVTWCTGTRTGANRWQATSGLRTYGDNKVGGWRLISLASYDAIMKPVTQSFDRMLGILLATLAGAVGLGFWWRAAWLKPILKLTEGAKTIAAGHFDARVVVTTHDEIGALAEAFNLMAETVERRQPNAPKLKSRCALPMTNWSSAWKRAPRQLTAEIARTQT